jgi:hypothetical protein
MRCCVLQPQKLHTRLDADVLDADQVAQLGEQVAGHDATARGQRREVHLHIIGMVAGGKGYNQTPTELDKAN